MHDFPWSCVFAVVLAAGQGFSSNLVKLGLVHSQFAEVLRVECQTSLTHCCTVAGVCHEGSWVW